MRNKISLMRKIMPATALLAVCTAWTDAQAQGDQESHALGKQLAETYCVSCHLAPNPEDIPKEHWPITLAAMGLYLGFEGDELPDFVSAKIREPYAHYNVAKTLTDPQGNEHEMVDVFKAFVHSEPVTSVENWRLIRDYYVENAPTKAEMFLAQPKHPVIEGFKPVIPNLEIEPNGLVLTTLVDEAKQHLYVGRAVGRPTGAKIARPEDLLSVDLRTGKRIGHSVLTTQPIHLEKTETGIRLSTHGNMPIDSPEQRAGSIIDWTDFGTEKQQARMLINGIQRVTQHHTHDLNGDGLEDIIVPMFGDGNLGVGDGRFTIFWQTPEYEKMWQDAPAGNPPGPLEGAFREEVLMELAGPVAARIADFNKDGRPDIALLVAQGLQQLILYINEGDTKFSRHLVKQHTPSFGGNSMYVEDMDGDGHTDIIVLNGDFGTRLPEDGFTLPKAHHGLRIYRNNGDLTFTESYHYPMHGAMKSTITDFDGDGDQDIAIIATYPRWEWDQPETFAYLENQGDFKFKPASLPRDYFGVWISIETGDVNADGKPDIVLGSANWPSFVPENWWATKEIMRGREGEPPTITFLLNDH